MLVVRRPRTRLNLVYARRSLDKSRSDCPPLAARFPYAWLVTIKKRSCRTDSLHNYARLSSMSFFPEIPYIYLHDCDGGRHEKKSIPFRQVPGVLFSNPLVGTFFSSRGLSVLKAALQQSRNTLEYDEVPFTSFVTLKAEIYLQRITISISGGIHTTDST